MKREILFRGKTVFSNHWVYGDLLYDGNLTYIHTLDMDYHITSASIGQFTGLVDKKSNKIFEGDIISFDNSNDLCIITFNRGCFMAIFKNDTSIPLDVYKNYTKIGNIFDNPELFNKFPKSIREQCR